MFESFHCLDPDKIFVATYVVGSHLDDLDEQTDINVFEKK